MWRRINSFEVRFEHHLDRYIVGREPLGADSLQRLTPTQAADLLRRVLSDGPHGRRLLHGLTRALGLKSGEPNVLEAKIITLAGRRLSPIAVARVPRSWVARNPEQAPPTASEYEADPGAPRADIVEDTDWIEFVVVDAHDAPIPGIHCELFLANGKRMRARSDRNGVVRVERIPAGPCEISLIDLDQSAWEPA